ncbi:MAG: YggT family protein [Gammaproteobacteria bacterium]|nr:YggT family protein [Gammaproteobacteria bacterium]
MGGPVAFVIQFILSAVAVLFLIRFILQATRADFYNPISQGIVRYTDPILKPLRIVIPSYRNLDFAAFVATWIVSIVTIIVAVIMTGSYSNATVVELIRSLGLEVGAIVGGVYRTLDLFLSFYWIAIFLSIIVSFVAPATYNPVISLLNQVCEPVLAPARRVLPALGGLDLSPLVVFLVLALLQRFFLPGLFRLLF